MYNMYNNIKYKVIIDILKLLFKSISYKCPIIYDEHFKYIILSQYTLKYL